MPGFAFMPVSLCWARLWTAAGGGCSSSLVKAAVVWFVRPDGSYSSVDVDLEHPVFSSNGEFEGSVSMLIRPDFLFSSIITPVLQGIPVEAFVMQTDGRILYDEDKEEVGRMLFEDPIYKPFPSFLHSDR
jgi:hypothetical protein